MTWLPGIAQVAFILVACGPVCHAFLPSESEILFCANHMHSCVRGREMANFAEKMTVAFYHEECRQLNGFWGDVKPASLGKEFCLEAPGYVDWASGAEHRPICQRMGNGNAFLHAYWNALMYYFISPSFAVSMATKHEEDQPYDESPIDRQMDYQNNEMGRNTAYLLTRDRNLAKEVGEKEYTFGHEKMWRKIARSVRNSVKWGYGVRLVRNGGAAPYYKDGKFICPTCVMVYTTDECEN